MPNQKYQLIFMKQVLLVPKKKSDGTGVEQHRVLVMSQASTGAEQQQSTIALSTQPGLQQQRVVSQVRKSSPLRLAAAVTQPAQASSTGVVAVTTRWPSISPSYIAVSIIFYQMCNYVLLLLPHSISLPGCTRKRTRVV